jgi:hypothetical protein
MEIEVTPLEFAFLELNRAIAEQQNNSCDETWQKVYKTYDAWVELMPKEQADKMRYVPGEASRRFAKLIHELG